MSFKGGDILMIISAYCGYIKDENKLKQSASGGLATAMAEYVIENDGVVYGVSYFPDGNFSDACYVRADTFDKIEKLKSSKYIKATLSRGIMDSVVEDLKNQNIVLFIGLPCDVFAIKSYVDKRGIPDDKLLTVDLICRGPTSPLVAKQFIENLEKKNKSKIIDFNVRYKNPLWKPPYLYAKFDNGKTFIDPFYETDYGIAFTMMTENKCYNCKNKGENHTSDVTIGDHHWATETDDVGYNKYGASVALNHTVKGENFVLSLENFNIFPTDIENAVKSNRRYLYPVDKTEATEMFKKNFQEGGLSYAVAKYLTRKQKFKRYIKKVLNR